jgi:hypothetical protein
MCLIRRQTPREAWPSLKGADKESICSKLDRIVAVLKKITQGSSGHFINTSSNPRLVAFIIGTLTSIWGFVDGGTVQDRLFKFYYEGEPFLTVKSFNDWLLAAATRQGPGLEGIIGLISPLELSLFRRPLALKVWWVLWIGNRLVGISKIRNPVSYCTG